MAVTGSVRIVKSSPYKGGTRLWSNRYSFDGTLPPDGTHWTTLCDAITAAEKLIFQANASIVEAVGYGSGSDVPVFSKVYSLAGTLTIGGSVAEAPLGACAVARWSTAAMSTKNHPIYAFSYWHHVYSATGTPGADLLAATQKTAMGTYATAWVSGFSDGTATHHRSTPGGHVATGSLIEQYISHRDFPYQSSV